MCVAIVQEKNYPTGCDHESIDGVFRKHFRISLVEFTTDIKFNELRLYINN